MLIPLIVLTLAVPGVSAAPCTYPEQGGERGYRLEGSTLHLPRGGSHSLPELSAAEAETVLRENYGLVGERDCLVRTK
ncbi:hypothetical protein [Devosia sp. RR2S18]|uniref:hypothetical protein n=1 Tax=Devosia rhizosphaerae TaxID=3049774 RepID=UPI0025417A3C|nr:hypothetical protein [Devosia sp. RR2S18]WIJ24023.1 hypothetical protein QOV41_13455 [Devosia sp. RR2S18]